MSALKTYQSKPVDHTTEKLSQQPVSPRLRVLLHCIFVIIALIAGNSAYLIGIRFLEWYRIRVGGKADLQNTFYLWMVLAHLAIGLALLVPLVVFFIGHFRQVRKSPNRIAARFGFALAIAAALVVVSGFGLLRLLPPSVVGVVPRDLVYWCHIATPCLAAWLYLMHRLAGPVLKWRQGIGHSLIAGAIVIVLTILHSGCSHSESDNAQADARSFSPSLAQTSNGGLIPAGDLMMDQYCLACHPDTYNSWIHSAHKLSSFNNPMYLASIREARDFSRKRDGTVAASRWCAGCHDPVPLFSGAFDNPMYDDVNDPTAHAGITCTVCHSIEAINSPRGNADYTISAPTHYPLTHSSNELLQYVNRQLVKGKPSFHKRTFLKPFHKTAEFCSTCHKVHLPRELTHYREFLRGQNHYDSYLISGVSGHGARSAYYPMQAAENCAKCHMPLVESNDFGAKPTGRDRRLTVHDHLFPGANTALSYLSGDEETLKRQQKFLSNAARVDIFALREGGRIDGEVSFPLRENIPLKEAHREGHSRIFSEMKNAAKLPMLEPGKDYLLDVVVRNLKTGHHLTQGTVDSNQVWVEVTAKSGRRVLGQSGAIDGEKRVDPNAHFVNAYVIDRDGGRIERRNPQQIFTVLYNHQIGPGSADVVHYALHLPHSVDELVTVEVRLLYRKFDSRFMKFVTETARPGDPPIRGNQTGKPYRNTLPVTVLATDRITFPVKGVSAEPPFQEYPIAVDHLSQRWTDYGIALMREGSGDIPTEKTGMELRLAERVFADVEKRFGYVAGPLSLAQLYLQEGRIDEAEKALKRAARIDKPLFFTEPVFAPWAILRVRGLIKSRQGDLHGAVDDLREALNFSNEVIRQHGFDFTSDYVVLNELGQMLIERAKLEQTPASQSARAEYLNQAIEVFQQTLAIDPENATAHHGLSIAYGVLGDESDAEKHRQLHARYKRDDNAHDRARSLARLRDPAANHAAERIVIYQLKRPGEKESGLSLRNNAAGPAIGGQR